jgi:hypothetical protein
MEMETDDIRGRNESKAIGGYARADALTSEERKGIARKAALARWDANVPQATHEGIVHFGDVALSAAVLPNGKRLLTQATFLRALGRSRSPKAGTGVLSTVDGIPFFLQAEALKPFISEDLLASTSPIFYRELSGRRAVGYEAELLPGVAEVYLKLRDAYLEEGKPISRQYAHIIRACDLIMRGLARVGIVALVDEATGYQEVRDRQALQVILDKYLTDEWAKWTKTFPDDYYQELFRLHGITYPGLKMQKPSYVGHWTNDIVYSRLAPGILQELKKKNPRNESGNRSRKHHQHFTKDYGHPELREHLSKVVFLMKACTSWSDFKKRLDRAVPKYEDTMPLALNYGEEQR